MLYRIIDAVDKNKPESLIITSIQSNVITQTQIKPKKSSEIKIVSRIRVQRKENECSLNVEVNPLQQRSNKIELEKNN